MGRGGVYGYLFYFVGSFFGLFSQVSAIGGLLLGRPAPLAGAIPDWLTAVIGSGCFAIGGVIQLVHNRIWRRENGHLTVIFWVCLSYFLGGIFFFVAASIGFAGAIAPSIASVAQGDLCDLGYLVGSLLYLVGAMLTLYMWKNEQAQMRAGKRERAICPIKHHEYEHLHEP